MENRDKDQRCLEKSKLQGRWFLARKRVLYLCYTLLHERVFLHYFHLNQITSLQHLIRVSFMRQLNQLKIQSTLHNIGGTYLKRFLVNVFQTSAELPQKQISKLQGIKKVITAITIITIIFLLLLFSL